METFHCHSFCMYDLESHETSQYFLTTWTDQPHVCLCDSANAVARILLLQPLQSLLPTLNLQRDLISKEQIK